MPFRLNCFSGVPETLQQKINIVCFYFCPAGPAVTTAAPETAENYSWTAIGVGATAAFASALGNPKAGDAVTATQKEMIVAYGQWDALVDGGGVIAAAGESLPGRVVGCPRGGPLCPAPHPPCDRIGSIVCGLFV